MSDNVVGNPFVRKDIPTAIYVYIIAWVLCVHPDWWGIAKTLEYGMKDMANSHAFFVCP